MRLALIAVAGAALLVGLGALLVTVVIRALRKFVRAVWPHS